ncbi:MAG TPA: VanZ family protein [Longimicrobiales bacterium]
MTHSDTPAPAGTDERIRAQSATLALILALAYTLTIAYASLQPFLGWRLPAAEVLYFVTAPWPQYVTMGDLLINTAAYIPLGFLLAVALSRRRTAARAVLLAAALGALLSLTMEAAQMFLPKRIASNVDLLTNGTGALIGAMAAPLFSPSRVPGRRLAVWREALFLPGTLVDTALVLGGLWLFTHLHPTAQFFGTGNLRATFELPVYLMHTPGRLISAEALVVFFNIIGLGLLLASFIRSGVSPLRVIAAVVGAGICLKILAAVALFSAPGPLLWLTPGVVMGLVAGGLVLYLLIGIPHTAKIVTALLCFGAAVAVINFAPDNPYQTAPSKLIPGTTTHLLRLSNIVRALSELWPFLVIGFLVVAAFAARTVPRRMPEVRDAGTGGERL